MGGTVLTSHGVKRSITIHEQRPDADSPVRRSYYQGHELYETVKDGIQ